MAGNFIPSAHLNASNQNRLPFSSPISEEILSPVSPVDGPRTLPLLPRKNLDPLSTQKSATGNTDPRRTHDSSTGFNEDSTGVSPQASPSGSVFTEVSRAETRNAALRRSRGFSVSKPSRDKPRRGMKGIRVVTNFSKHHDVEPITQRPADLPLGPYRQPGNTNQVRKGF
jgi:hypothetical protein